jgi:tetratricopeptide (TPR) repeat protein
MYYSGRFEEAIALLLRAMRLQPYYPTWYLWLLGASYRMVGRSEEALAVQKQVLEKTRTGEFSPAMVHLSLALTYMSLGRDEEARAQAEELLRIHPEFSLESIRQMCFFKDPAHLESLLDLARKAGLPE